ncbi:hypothetical protein GIB67_002880 [Kingdonia uniflora]|uniref:Uncharacterized protein n=1 Tax=Kingdonia uniflora TaxID=39325 RepID=A0A7J7NQM9_9MAGN|nr:hypothetical protein GIB67_002880 [Kingdonia uniflora]
MMGDYDSNEEDMIALAAAAIAASHYCENNISKEPCRNSKLTGKKYIVELVDGNPVRIKIVQERYQHSGETVRRHFNTALDVVVSLAPKFLQRAKPDTLKEILNDIRFFSIF